MTRGPQYNSRALSQYGFFFFFFFFFIIIIIIIVIIFPAAFLARALLSQISFQRNCAAPTAHLNARTCW